MEKNELNTKIEVVIAKTNLDDKQKNELKNILSENLITLFNDHETKNRLDLLFEYEKKHLELLKEFKEEIKFVNSIHEDLRRERSSFFTQILKEASESLKKADVGTEIASLWIQDLVNSYTNSLNVCDELVKTSTVDIISKLRSETTNELSKAASFQGKENATPQKT